MKVKISVIIILTAFFVGSGMAEGPDKLKDYWEKPTDPDNDGLYEDVNGDGLIKNDAFLLDGTDLIFLQTRQTRYFDFDRDGDLDSNDIAALNEEEEKLIKEYN